MKGKKGRPLFDPKQCKGCKYRRHDGYGNLGWYCGYMFYTGLSRLAQTSPEDRESGRCPVRVVGRPTRTIVRPRVHKFDIVIREEVERADE